MNENHDRGWEEVRVKRMDHKNGETKMFLEPFNEDEYNKIVNEIAQAVKKSLNPEDIVKAGLSLLDFDEVRKIHRLIKDKARIKGRKGCYEISVGNHIIPIVPE